MFAVVIPYQNTNPSINWKCHYQCSDRLRKPFSYCIQILLNQMFSCADREKFRTGGPDKFFYSKYLNQRISQRAVCNSLEEQLVQMFLEGGGTIFYTPPHFSVGVLCYTFRCLSVRPSVRAHHFRSIT